MATEFVENLTRPNVGPDLLGPNSSDRCRWRCHCGHTWRTTPGNRVKAGPGCTKCRCAAKLSADQGGVTHYGSPSGNAAYSTVANS
ncbi:zinc-ribbon domain-containing protein [Saccharopolyspora sp. NPDC050642]|uniref:zinc-ribbon domain-containing protein n=1 Tax=Saccharopolyspora sp. NPDC050642 TaxID=3157099 RepID=UPI0033C6F59D